VRDTVNGSWTKGDNNLDIGIWGDTNNAGFTMSGNYISDHCGKGIVYEISYNAQIENNTLVALSGAADGSRTAACLLDPHPLRNCSIPSLTRDYLVSGWPRNAIVASHTSTHGR